MGIFEMILIWIFAAIGVGAWAEVWYRSKGDWFFLALFLSPLVSSIILLFFGKLGHVCEKCQEHVNSKAVKCRHCGSDIVKKPEPVPDYQGH